MQLVFSKKTHPFVLSTCWVSTVFLLRSSITVTSFVVHSLWPLGGSVRQSCCSCFASSAKNNHCLHTSSSTSSTRTTRLSTLSTVATTANKRCWKNRNSIISGRSMTSSSSTSTTRLHAKTEAAVPRHDTGTNQIELSPEVEKAMNEYQIYQQSAPKLSSAVDVRSLVSYNHGFAVMSTFSKAYPDYPGGSVVGFAVDNTEEGGDGRPIFVFSGMSTHTQDLLVNPKCSLTVAAKDFKGAADGRVNLMGTCTLIKDAAEKEKARDIYMKKHPGAFWSSFGDFNWFRMDVEYCRFVGGFARAGTVSASEYRSAKPDPIAEFGGAIAAHMNDDHMAATIAIVQALVPGMNSNIPDNPIITEAIITSVDSLGMYVKVTRSAPVAYLPQQFKLRLPFPRPARDRKDVRTLIVEMTQQASEVPASADAAAAVPSTADTSAQKDD